MHQPILAPDLSSDSPARVALRTASGTVYVPAWWAAEEGYSEGRTLLHHEASEALEAAICAGKADFSLSELTRIRTRPMDPHIPQEARVRPPVLDACPQPSPSVRRARAALLILSAAVSAGAVIVILRSVL